MISESVIDRKIDEIDGRPWHPVKISEEEGGPAELALFQGEYHWHSHPDKDETFQVLIGKITIQLRDEVDIVLEESKSATIPRDVEHCPKSDQASYVLMSHSQ